MALDRRCLTVLLAMPAANELSVWMGVAGCGWPISMRAVRSIEEEGSNFGFTGGGDDMLHEARDGVNGSVVARWIGIFVGWNFVAEEEGPPIRLLALGSDRYDASL